MSEELKLISYVKDKTYLFMASWLIKLKESSILQFSQFPEVIEKEFSS